MRGEDTGGDTRGHTHEVARGRYRHRRAAGRRWRLRPPRLFRHRPRHVTRAVASGFPGRSTVTSRACPEGRDGGGGERAPGGLGRRGERSGGERSGENGTGSGCRRRTLNHGGAEAVGPVPGACPEPVPGAAAPGRQGRVRPPRSACPSRCPSQVTAEQLRARGNALFQAGDHAAALAAYTEALGLCDSGPERAVLHRNRAACHLRLVSVGTSRCRREPARPGALPGPAQPGRLRLLRACAGRPRRSSGRSCRAFPPLPFPLPCPPCRPLSGLCVLWGCSQVSHSVPGFPPWSGL